MMTLYALSTNTSRIKREISTVSSEVRKKRVFMIKRVIKAVLCGLSLMSILSINVLPVQAAWCEHKICYTAYGSVKAYHYEQDGHYKEVGTVHICADCGHEERENLHSEWYESHDWEMSDSLVTSNGTSHIRYRCSNPNCDATLGDF